MDDFIWADGWMDWQESTIEEETHERTDDDCPF